MFRVLGYYWLAFSPILISASPSYSIKPSKIMLFHHRIISVFSLLKASQLWQWPTFFPHWQSSTLTLEAADCLERPESGHTAPSCEQTKECPNGSESLQTQCKEKEPILFIITNQYSQRETKPSLHRWQMKKWTRGFIWKGKAWVCVSSWAH